jgi:cytochrome c
MDTFELNKILGAVLGTCIVVLTANICTDSFLLRPLRQRRGYKIAAPEQPASASAANVAEVALIETRLAAADVDRGKSISKACIHVIRWKRAAQTRLARIFGVSSTGREHPSPVTTIRQQ